MMEMTNEAKPTRNKPQELRLTFVQPGISRTRLITVFSKTIISK